MEKYSLRTLQMAYLSMELQNEKQDEDTCIYCWKKYCGCSSKQSIKDDLFLNFSGEELHYI